MTAGRTHRTAGTDRRRRPTPTPRGSGRTAEHPGGMRGSRRRGAPRRCGRFVPGLRTSPHDVLPRIYPEHRGLHRPALLTPHRGYRSEPSRRGSHPPPEPERSPPQQARPYLCRRRWAPRGSRSLRSPTRPVHRRSRDARRRATPAGSSRFGDRAAPNSGTARVSTAPKNLRGGASGAEPRNGERGVRAAQRRPMRAREPRAAPANESEGRAQGSNVGRGRREPRPPALTVAGRGGGGGQRADGAQQHQQLQQPHHAGPGPAGPNAYKAGRGRAGRVRAAPPLGQWTTSSWRANRQEAPPPPRGPAPSAGHRGAARAASACVTLAAARDGR